MRSKEFFKSSQEIVKNFLNSVVAVDDQLCFGRINATSTDHVHEDFDAPVDGSGLGVLSVSQEADISTQKITHQLDYQDLSISFSEHGINCCGFIPDVARFPTIDVAAESIMKSSKRADITILDWSMDSTFAGASKGTLAIESIKKIIQHDRSQHGRLRLIVIYTAENSIEQIVQDIKNNLHSPADSGINAEITDSNIKFLNSELEFCKISVIAKKPNSTELRDEVINLFTELTIGLLSNATISAIGELRDKTHNILHTFNKNLDPAYLSHVIGLLSSPDVREKSHEIAFDYATDLISEELKSNLQISHTIKNNLNLDRLKEWADFVTPNPEDDHFKIKVGDGDAVGIKSDRLKKLLSCSTDTHLIAALTAAPVILKKESKDSKTLDNFRKKRIQLNLQSTEYLSHENLSAIECKRRDIFSLKTDEPQPTIKQGSIVKMTYQQNIDGEIKDAYKYYVCMQPLCDSVRIQNITNFIFLEIDAVNEGKDFTHLLKDSNGDFIRFKIKPSSKDIHIFRVVPDVTTNTVKTQYSAGEYKVKYITDNSQENFLVWLGELKTNIAQAISNKLAEQISRVGLDTNEWLRLSSSVH